MKRFVLFASIAALSLSFSACETCGKGGTTFKFLNVENLRLLNPNNNNPVDTISRTTGPYFHIHFEVKGYAQQPPSFSFFNTAYACSPANFAEYEKNDSMLIIADTDVTGIVRFKKNDIINELILFNNQRTDTEEGILLKNHLRSSVIGVDVLKVTGQKIFAIHIERRYLGQTIWKSQTITILE